MMSYMTPQRSLTLLCFGLALAGCSTPVKRAGTEHEVAITKWNELARYAETALRNYPLAITAQLGFADPKDRTRFQLKNIRLSKKDNSYNINLLDPVFAHKYICTPVCDQLLEYMPLSEDSGSTLLNQYFSTHEFELFAFYGELFKLNEKIQQLKQINATEISDFLDYLIDERQHFSELASFSEYLSERLSEDHYRDFLSDPAAKAVQQHTRYLSAHFKLALKPGEHWQQSSAAAAESQSWLPPGGEEAKAWKSGAGAELRHWNSGHAAQASVLDLWQLAKNQPIDPGAYVCSYTDNKFGRVTRVTLDKVSVELLGQAKVLQDGVIFDTPQGALFSPGPEPVSFLPLNGSQEFSLHDVAACQMESGTSGKG